MISNRIEGIAPPLLEHALIHMREACPDDSEVLDRLFGYLENNRPLLSEIRDAICEFYLINRADMIDYKRITEISLARQMFCYVAYRYTRCAMKTIGNHIGRHPSTVLHAIRNVESLAMRMGVVRDDLDLLRLRVAEKMLRRASCSDL